MQISVLFFGMLNDWAGASGEALTMPDNATLGDVLEHYQRAIPRLRDFASAIAMSVNQEYAGVDRRLKAGDEIGFLPPVSGGSSRASIVRDKIDSAGVLDQVKRPEDGAAVLFDGVVRNNTRGRGTRYLDYESYEEMALKQMESLAEQAIAQFGVRDVRIVHRLGRLEIGETSVLIVVASAHRGAAFDACRWVIDTLKRTVPIWKKEYFEDGAVWADGESFPAEIPRAGGISDEKSASK
jgi:molybdopterin synthase catalytic subunit